jgi:capsular polysaccharide biosynthesis protein
MRLETLAWVGVQEEDVVWLSNDATQFDEVSLITTNSIHSHTHDYTGIRDVVRLATHGRKFDRGRRLYVARPDALRRSITNQADIEDMLAKAGFDIVMPDGSFTAAEQIDLFRSASVIAGVSGAALTNLMWMRPDTQVLSFNPNLGYEFFFWDLANIMNVRFSLIFGEAVSQEKGVHSDFTVDTLLVKNWLDGLKAN